MPYGTSLNLAALALAASCVGCIIPVSPAPSIKLEDYTFRKTFDDIATNGSWFGIIKTGMAREQVLKIMNGYLVRGPVDAGHGEVQDYFGGLIAERKSLYVAAWHGPYSWGVHGEKEEFGMIVNYDKQLKVIVSESVETNSYSK